MRDASVYPPAGGWVITDQGREDWRTLPTCECKLIFEGALVRCLECGTVYATSNALLGGRPVLNRKRD